MSKHSAVAFPPPQAVSADPLTEVLRQGAKRLLAQAIEAEVQTLLACDADVRDEQGRQAVVRNGYLPEREVQTGLGAVSVHVPRVRGPWPATRPLNSCPMTTCSSGRITSR